MYAILNRNGFTFGALGMDYVITDESGKVIVRDMNKKIAESKFMAMVNAPRRAIVCTCSEDQLNHVGCDCLATRAPDFEVIYTTGNDTGADGYDCDDIMPF